MKNLIQDLMSRIAAIPLLFASDKTLAKIKERQSNEAIIIRFNLFKQVHANLPEQLRTDEMMKAIAEQINYATASDQFEGNTEEMQVKLMVLLDKLLQNGATEAARLIAIAVDLYHQHLAPC